MKPDIFRLVKACVEIGVARGLNRAYKNNDEPTDEQIHYAIKQEVMLEICEWFEFEPRED